MNQIPKMQKGQHNPVPFKKKDIKPPLYNMY